MGSTYENRVSLFSCCLEVFNISERSSIDSVGSVLLRDNETLKTSLRLLVLPDLFTTG